MTLRKKGRRSFHSVKMSDIGKCEGISPILTVLFSIVTCFIFIASTEESTVLKPGQFIVWTKEMENYLEYLWEKYERKVLKRKEKIFNDAKAKFKELDAVGMQRVYWHAKWLSDKKEMLQGPRDSQRRKVRKKDTDEIIVDGIVNWKPNHNNYLLELWNKYPLHMDKRSQLIVHDALEEFPELNAVTPRKIYYRALSLARKKRLNEASTSNQEPISTPRHVQYHMFINDQIIPSASQETHHNHDWIDLNTRPSNGEPDSELRLNTLNFGDRSPDKNLKLR